MSRYLVTGGAGFIGGHIVELLVSEGHDVTVFDNFCAGSMDNLAAVQDRTKVIRADIRDAEAIRSAAEGVDHIIHQAAEISVVKSVEEPAFVNAVNVGGTINVLDAARACGVKRVVLASSCAIYGDTGTRPQKEDFLPQPLSPYGASKMAGEYYLSAYYQVYGLETVRLRYFNVFGPRQNPKSQYAAAIPIFIERILTGREIVIHGDGEQTRDFVYVGNVARANYLACTSPEARGGVFNIAGGQTVSINSLVERLIATSGRGVTVRHGESRVGDIKYSASDTTLARDVLGYEPTIGFDEGLERTFGYFAAKAGAV